MADKYVVSDAGESSPSGMVPANAWSTPTHGATAEQKEAGGRVPPPRVPSRRRMMESIDMSANSTVTAFVPPPQSASPALRNGDSLAAATATAGLHSPSAAADSSSVGSSAAPAALQSPSSMPERTAGASPKLTVNIEPAATPAAAAPAAAPSPVSVLKKTPQPSRKVAMPSKSKMMALVGEMLPQNALDPTGYENHEAEEKKKKEEEEEAAAEEMEDGQVEIDEFGNRRFTTLRARIRARIRRRLRKMWKVADPTSSHRQYWSLVVMVLLLYGMIEIPLRIGFEQDVEPWSGPDIFNLLVDIFFLIDVVINFRTGYFQDDSRLVLDERRIAVRYIKGWFALDIITSIPFSQITQLALNGSRQTGMAALALPRLLRIFRIARLFKILRMLKLMNNMSNWSESTNERLFALLLKCTKFVTAVFLLSHLSGCVWGFLALQQKDTDGNFDPTSWPYKYGVYNYYEVHFSRLYLLSLYWALCTLTTTGYGDIHAASGMEYGFCIVLTFVGTCMFGYIIGTISSILKHGKEAEERYAMRMMELNLYMSYRKISPFLQKKVRQHYEYLWKKQTLYAESDIVDELPAHLQADLSNFLYKDLVARVPFLADMGPECALLVTLRLKPLQLSPGSYIFTKGSLGKEMYFVGRGTVDVIDGQGFILCQLQEGSYFGEYAILSEKPVYRTASIRGRTFVDLLALSKLDFEYIWNLYPEIYARIITRAKQQWQLAMADIKKKREADAAALHAASMKVLEVSQQGNPQAHALAKIGTRGRTLGLLDTNVADEDDEASTNKSVADKKPPTGSTGAGARGDTVIRIDKSVSGGGDKAAEGVDSKNAGGGADRLHSRRPKLSVLTMAESMSAMMEDEDDAAAGGGNDAPMTLAEQRALARMPRDHALGEHTVMRASVQLVSGKPEGPSSPSRRARNGSGGNGGVAGDEDSDNEGEGGIAGGVTPRGGGDDDYDDDSDDYYDSLDGLSSENDDDYDEKADAIDLPEHLLPPPKPIIRGSFVPADMVVHSMSKEQNEAQRAMRTHRRVHPAFKKSAADKLLSLFNTDAAVTPNAAQRRMNKQAALDRHKTRTAERSGRRTLATRPSQASASRPLGTGNLTPMLSPALGAANSDVEMAPVQPLRSALKRVSGQPTELEANRAAVAAAAAAKPSATNRDSIFSTMLLTPAAGPANAGNSSARRGVLEGAGTESAQQPSADAAAAASGNGATSSQPGSSRARRLDADQPQPASVVQQALAAAALSLPPDVASSPALWQGVQQVLSGTMAPLHAQYATLVDEHRLLQQKQQHTEQLLRTVVAKLKEERQARGVVANGGGGRLTPPSAPAPASAGGNNPRSPTPPGSHSPISPGRTLAGQGQRQPLARRTTSSVGGPIMKKT